ncbi:FtsQ-type POTRA domain-containing protein [Microbacterium betulae]|uniref:FtsQ-type POTRA domain-containing protein n=1 Tax=Microbacterium betulae TaxID=2981139 RepID=A0AA97FFA5_9MICO|nr:FtsQ-type POTRA domain-containing protein [Microbacterium sp. AB]WOF21838.1 FtsQ-type POTRA domain-containing protein [Microbacterium sp. AB]
MRRPGPLPPSSTGREATSSAEDEERILSRRRATMKRLGIDAETREAQRGDESSETAPIVTLRPEGDAADPDDGSRAGGWRAVWRATRARRRAMRAEMRRFTARSRRRRLIWTVAIGALLLLVAGSAGAAYSPLFAVEEITVEGAEQLDAAAVEAALSDQVGTPLPLVDHSAVRAALLGFPLIETYTLEANPPHDLVVRVVERTPVGVIESEAGFTTVDAAGVALATAGERPAGLPLVSTPDGAGSDAFLAVGQVLRSLPDDLRAQVTAASATTTEDVTLTLGDGGPQVVWGSVDDSAEKTVVLQSAMEASLPEGVTVYDVSAPGTLIVR